LIDDDDTVAGSLRQYLAMQGCDVHVAVDGESARAAMRSGAYDAIVVDPYLTGAIHGETDAFFSSIGELQPFAATIVLTAYPSPELSRAAAGCRPAAVLTKPQSVVYLGELVSAPRASSKGQTV
jgi:DNA-binding NtrC family response regulator